MAVLPFISDQRLAVVIDRNRGVLAKIPAWISDDTYYHSICRYGLPEHLRKHIDSDVGSEPTYSDVLMLLAGRLKKPVSFLELGVSVGKNFLQAAESLQNSVLVGFDIELINPVLRGCFGKEEPRGEWRTMAGSLKKSASTFTEFAGPAGNRIFYLCADLGDDNAWKRLINFRFNLLFSDAVHSPEAIIAEYSRIRRWGLLDPDEFVIVWDDLAGPMEDAFQRIARDLEDAETERHLVELNGWLGPGEPPHKVGIITRFKGRRPG